VSSIYLFCFKLVWSPITVLNELPRALAVAQVNMVEHMREQGYKIANHRVYSEKKCVQESGESLFYKQASSHAQRIECIGCLGSD
jgi:hypothetical protein